MDVGFFIFGLMGLLGLICFIPPLAIRLKLPYAVLLAVIGCSLGIFIHSQTNTPLVLTDFFNSLLDFHVSSETFLMVFLPVLLFETALNMNIRRLMDDWAPILLMAIVAVVICTVAAGALLYQLSSYGLIACLLLGAIIATTDPVSVVGIFKEVGAPKRLSNLVEGESLFNDAASIALYSVLLSAITSQTDLTINHILSSFITGFLGGIITGYLFGRLACFLFQYLRGFPQAEITLTVTLAYLTFFISEHYLQVSGVVATVIAGLVIGSSGRTRMSPTTFELLGQAWSQFGFWANSLIFIFAAMLIPRIMEYATWNDVWLTIALFVVAHVSRFFVVFVLLPLLGKTPFATSFSHAYKTVMLWGGLRGAVSLALALAVTEHHDIPVDIRHFIAVTTTGFVLMTLFINGTTMSPLIRLLKLDRLSDVEIAVRNQVQQLAIEEVLNKTRDIADQERLSQSTRAHIEAIFHEGLDKLKNETVTQLSTEKRVLIGLVISSRHESELLFSALKAELLDWYTIEGMMEQAEVIEDMARNQGIESVASKFKDELKHTLRFKVTLLLYRYLNIERWFSQSLEQRVNFLLFKRIMIKRMIQYTQTEIKPILNEDVAQTLNNFHSQRLQAVDQAIIAHQQYHPNYLQWLEEHFLGRIARALERQRYTDMKNQQLITHEVYEDLLTEVQARWDYLDSRPQLDALRGTLP